MVEVKVTITTMDGEVLEQVTVESIYELATERELTKRIVAVMEQSNLIQVKED
jgi:hypothetical protein